MMTEICQYLKNWFEQDHKGRKLPGFDGAFTISGGLLEGADKMMLPGQHYRISGSILNDGVHKHPASGLADEEFEGRIQTMAVPAEVAKIADEAKAWQEKHGSLDSPAMSPFSGESFGGYSYSKLGGDSCPTWKEAFGTRLAPWRKL